MAAFFLTIVILVSAALSQTQTVPAQDADAVRLRQILEKTSDYCRKLENAVLDFVCLEEVRETIREESVEKDFRFGAYRLIERPVDNTFLYEYQLIRNADKTEESRTLVERNGKKLHEKAAGIGTLRFRFEKIVYGPVDLLRLPNQPHFDYAILKEESHAGDGQIIIEAVPKPEEKEYLPFGKIWVRAGDFAILKIEYDQRSIRNLFEESPDRKPEKGTPRFVLTSEFDVERNGIRFPSRLVFQETYVDKAGKASVRSHAEVRYKDYRFFSVMVDVDYK